VDALLCILRAQRLDGLAELDALRAVELHVIDQVLEFLVPFAALLLCHQHVEQRLRLRRGIADVVCDLFFVVRESYRGQPSPEHFVAPRAPVGGPLQQAHDLGVASLPGDLERGLAAVILLGPVRPRPHQQPHALEPAVLGGVVQGGPAVVVRRVLVGAPLQERLDAVGLAVGGGGDDERGAAVRVRRVEVRPVLAQQLHRV